MPRPFEVDPRPQAERVAARAVRAMWLGLAGCTLLGAGGAATLAVWLTKPRD